MGTEQEVREEREWAVIIWIHGPAKARAEDRHGNLLAEVMPSTLYHANYDVVLYSPHRKHGAPSLEDGVHLARALLAGRSGGNKSRWVHDSLYGEPDDL